MITLSRQGYTSKPTQIPTIEYIRKDMDINEIGHYIINGHAISANFNYNENAVITQKQRTLDKFMGTHFIMLDLDDDVQMDLSELNESLKLKPTLSYTTYSHHQEGKGNRYRLLYFFNEMITDVDVYRTLYDIIVEVNQLTIKDGCGRNPVQNVLGTNYTLTDFSFINSEHVYSIAEVMELQPKEESASESYKRGGESSIDFKCTLRERTITIPEFMDDYKNMPISLIIEKYANIYPSIEETPLPETDADTPFILYPKDYVCIKRKWIPFEVKKEDGETRCTITQIRRWKDGEGRRKKLFWNGILRRLITNDAITYDNLLFNLLYEFYYYHEHTEINKNTIQYIANRVWDENLERHERLRGSEHKFKVNPLFCEKYGMRPHQVKQIAIKQFNDDLIGELYDIQMTDKENIEVFKEHGLKVSLRKLKAWRKENGISKYRKKGTNPS